MLFTLLLQSLAMVASLPQKRVGNELESLNDEQGLSAQSTSEASRSEVYAEDGTDEDIEKEVRRRDEELQNKFVELITSHYLVQKDIDAILEFKELWFNDKSIPDELGVRLESITKETYDTLTFFMKMNPDRYENTMLFVSNLIRMNSRRFQ